MCFIAFRNKSLSCSCHLCAFVFSETGPNAASHKEVMKLRRDNQNLVEENNMLKLKIDILLDMVCVRIK